MGKPVTKRGVRLYVKDLLGVNIVVTMHMISSVSSMDEANRLFAKWMRRRIAVLDVLPNKIYLALKITRILYYYFIYYSHQMFLTATGETECLRPSLSIINTTKDSKLLVR